MQGVAIAIDRIARSTIPIMVVADEPQKRETPQRQGERASVPFRQKQVGAVANNGNYIGQSILKLDQRSLKIITALPYACKYLTNRGEEGKTTKGVLSNEKG